MLDPLFACIWLPLERQKQWRKRPKQRRKRPILLCLWANGRRSINLLAQPIHTYYSIHCYTSRTAHMRKTAIVAFCSLPRPQPTNTPFTLPCRPSSTAPPLLYSDPPSPPQTSHSLFSSQPVDAPKKYFLPDCPRGNVYVLSVYADADPPLCPAGRALSPVVYRARCRIHRY